ncbi:MAG: 4-hydroxy-tetrahydrodipicolinate reductase [Candidatus Aenigmarchaeota archaeon]|nr:4-hydroxy-tetrahydrodipicolinate reductase [Candidatus Aenigmarchaeota archaeon]
MNIAIIGYGKMGKTIEKLAEDKQINVKSVIDPFVERDGKFFHEISMESLDGVDVCIDFTQPDVIMDNIRTVTGLGKNIVVGTTGWYDKEKEVRKIVDDAGIGFVYASNFSIGVNLMFRISAYAARLFNRFKEYDIYAYELHHNQKLDSPSGTALKLGELLIKNFDRKKKLVIDRLDRRIEPDEMHFASIRGGSIPCSHVVGFDALANNIEIKQTARGREEFADGALSAAQWINGKKGYYKFEDMMDEIIGGDQNE